ncbi:MAG: hypothetical protein FJY79_08985 [Candidatus Aminicenantes bacterium]|nr:hypothetical protein [Candidatus Aminicenantes bacterium]
MKRAVVVLVLAGFAAALSAQSVADLARKERERREALKGRRATVVTNDDLLRVAKRPAVEISSRAPGWDIVEGDEPERVTGPESATGPGTVVSAPEAAEGSSRRITPRVTAPGPSLMPDRDAVDQMGMGAGPLEAQLKAAEELVDLLETKLAALKQEYEFQNNMVPNYVIEKELNDTYQRLQKAQAQEARIRAEAGRKSRERRAPGESDR